MSKLYLVVWPSLMVAAVAEVLFFAVIDPQDLYLFGKPVYLSNLATYSIGFFLFWAICAASSFATGFFLRSGDEINREVNHLPDHKPG